MSLQHRRVALKNLTGNHPGGPTVTGAWDDDDTALRAYRKYVGLYGNPDSEVIIQLVKETEHPQGPQAVDPGR